MSRILPLLVTLFVCRGSHAVTLAMALVLVLTTSTGAAAESAPPDNASKPNVLFISVDAPSWDEYFPPKETEDPFPRTLMPNSRPVSLPRGGPWQYSETDWGAIDATDEKYGGDWLVSKWIGEQLTTQHEQPFFLACGIYRPHEPWFVPRKYFDQFPLERIELPPGYKADDLDDLPPAGKRHGPGRDSTQDETTLRTNS